MVKGGVCIVCAVIRNRIVSCQSSLSKPLSKAGLVGYHCELAIKVEDLIIK